MKRDRCGWSGKRCDCKRISFTTALRVARELFVGIARSWVEEMRLSPIMNDGASCPSNSACVVARHRKLLGHVVVLRALNQILDSLTILDKQPLQAENRDPFAGY